MGNLGSYLFPSLMFMGHVTHLSSAWTTKQMGWLSPSSVSDGVHLRMYCPVADLVRLVLNGPLKSSSEILKQAKEEKALQVRLNISKTNPSTNGAQLVLCDR